MMSCDLTAAIVRSYVTSRDKISVLHVQIRWLRNNLMANDVSSSAPFYVKRDVTTAGYHRHYDAIRNQNVFIFATCYIKM